MGCNCSESQISVLTGSKGDPGSVPGVLATSVVGNTVTFTTAQSGMTLTLDSTAATTVTLPTAAVGLTYTIVSTATPATSDTITAPGAIYTGATLAIVSTNAPLVYAPNGTTNNIITLGAATGGNAGSVLTLTCYVAGKWSVSGYLIGTPAPLSSPYSG